MIDNLVESDIDKEDNSEEETMPINKKMLQHCELIDSIINAINHCEFKLAGLLDKLNDKSMDIDGWVFYFFFFWFSMYCNPKKQNTKQNKTKKEMK